MKASFVANSCNYNITFSKEDFVRLLKCGYVAMSTEKTECTGGRAVLNKTRDGLEYVDKKEVRNGLIFELNEPIVFREAGQYCIPFLSIILDDECKKYLKELLENGEL